MHSLCRQRPKSLKLPKFCFRFLEFMTPCGTPDRFFVQNYVLWIVIAGSYTQSCLEVPPTPPASSRSTLEERKIHTFPMPPKAKITKISEILLQIFGIHDTVKCSRSVFRTELCLMDSNSGICQTKLPRSVSDPSLELQIHPREAKNQKFGKFSLQRA